MAKLLDGLSKGMNPDILKQDKNWKKILDKLFGDSTVYNSAVFQVMLEQNMTLKEAARLEPRHMDALFRKGADMMAVGNYKDAILWFEACCGVDPLDFRFFYGLGTCLQMEREYKAAVAALMNGMAWNATYLPFYLRLGDCHMANNENEMAAEFFSTAIKLGAKKPEEKDNVEYAQRMIDLIKSKKK
jgi:tetratricopeptide (TPR) repeat protein